MEDRFLKTILSNTMKHTAEWLLRMDDSDQKVDRLNVIFNFQKIINNYDELEPILKQFFNEKAEREKWER